MGRPIVYCSDCGRSLREADFEKGLASTIGNAHFCSTCRAVAPAAPPPARVASGRTPKPFAAAPRRTSTALVAGVVCGAALLILVVGVTMSGGRPPPPSAEPRAAAVVERPTPKEPVKMPDVAEERALAVKERAERFERTLKDIRLALDDARFDERREEIRAMLGKAGELAGARQAEVDGLTALFTRRNAEAALRNGLVGHWKLDDLSGTSAADASGNNLTGKVVGRSSWVAARVGSGLETKGGGEHVELPDVEVLKSLQNGAFTLALWYQPREAPPGADPALQGLVVKAGAHTGLMYDPQGFFRFDIWLSKNHAVIADRKVPAGRFYHVAGTWQPETGASTLYLNGAPVKMRAAVPKSATRGYGAERWRLGAGLGKPDKYQAWSRGVLDDVRLYSRALSAEDIRSLYESAK